jgi:predicted GTPase
MEQKPVQSPTWKGKIAKFWENISFPLKKLPSVANWFNVSEAEIVEILAKIKQELPTTEVILIGKPQGGKSSIIRGLTGVSAEIVGQGFRPHTQHTQKYAYPSSDLPLLIFTDTVGLGDINQETGQIIEELGAELDKATPCARILILR